MGLGIVDKPSESISADSERIIAHIANVIRQGCIGLGRRGKRLWRSVSVQWTEQDLEVTY